MLAEAHPAEQLHKPSIPRAEPHHTPLKGLAFYLDKDNEDAAVIDQRRLRRGDHRSLFSKNQRNPCERTGGKRERRVCT